MSKKKPYRYLLYILLRFLEWLSVYLPRPFVLGFMGFVAKLIWLILPNEKKKVLSHLRIAFGSTKMPVLEAMRWLKKEGIIINFLKVSYLSPFPSDFVANVVKNAKKILVIEGNKTGQFESLIKEHTGLAIGHHFRKYDGRPFYPEEIVAKVKEIL